MNCSSEMIGAGIAYPSEKGIVAILLIEARELRGVLGFVMRGRD